jgi:amino acid adenylation domain-containing protein
MTRLSAMASDHLAAGFLRSSDAHPERPALVVDAESLSYEELRRRASGLASVLLERTPAEGPPWTGVFAHRSVTGFMGVLAALLRGHGYVPLNRTFPVRRTRTMLERSGCRALVVDAESAAQLPDLLADARDDLLVVAPDLEDISDLAGRLLGHTVVGRRDLVGNEEAPALAPPADDAVAYLLFTSGSTGQPKGVLVTHRNVTPFIRTMADRYGIEPDDRLSQTFDLTFDLSVFDMFVAWERGASLHCLPDKTLLKPGGFIRDHELTVWFSVPSVAMFLRRFGMLKPGAYPSLRWSLFCGEALPVEIAEAWAAAAPNSLVENLYGPTEATIACTVYRWAEERSREESRLGIVPIGRPTPGMAAAVVGADLAEVATEEEGELLVAGPQVTLGYLDDQARTDAAFVRPPGKTALHYRTGDRVVRSRGGDLHYLGRVDNQIQVHGHRVELGEVEAALRDALGVDEVVAMGWPITESGAGGVVAFVVANGSTDVSAARSAVATRLPEYMVPRTIYALPEMPLNANGKFDRAALRALLEAT